MSHYFLIVPDLPYDIYIGQDVIVRLNACIDSINNIIWAPLLNQLTASVNLKNIQSGQTMPDACDMITEQEATIPAYCKSVSVASTLHVSRRPNGKGVRPGILENGTSSSITVLSRVKMELPWPSVSNYETTFPKLTTSLIA